MNTKKIIPSEDLAFCWMTIKKIEDYKEHLVNAMPFNLNEIRGLKDGEHWLKLKDLAVNYLVEEKELPSFAKEQDYQMTGMCSFQTFSNLVNMANSLNEVEEEGEETEITVFNNAFDKIILPKGYRERIIETISQLKDYKIIFEDWGLGEKIKRGKGINLLFSGESGTGKTYCGEIIADYLGTSYEIVSVASIESKWVGESEKNISSIFKKLKGNNSVLILDEVDSFLSSRSEDKQHHENKLTNQFLIELERHNGICVMTTNRPVKMDKALSRRVDLALNFPFPDKTLREHIWKFMIPDKMPVVDDLDFNLLSDIALHGGQIKNTLLSVARHMVTNKIRVGKTDLFLKMAKKEKKETDILLKGDFS